MHNPLLLLLKHDFSEERIEKQLEKLKEIIEKPKEFSGDLINAGLYKFTPEVFNKISEIKKSPRGEMENPLSTRFLPIIMAIPRVPRMALPISFELIRSRRKI